MRSRYSAFAFGLVDYVIGTTDPAGSSYDADRDAWSRSIRDFAAATRFAGLELLDSSMNEGEGEGEGTVAFRAVLYQGSREVSFTELSHFRRVDGRWLYVSGEVTPG